MLISGVGKDEIFVVTSAAIICLLLISEVAKLQGFFTGFRIL